MHNSRTIISSIIAFFAASMFLAACVSNANKDVISFCRIEERTFVVSYINHFHAINEMNQNVSSDTLFLSVNVQQFKQQSEVLLSVPDEINVLNVQGRIFKVSDIENCGHIYSPPVNE